MSHRRILTVHINLPHQGAGAEPTVQVDAVRSRLFRIKDPLDLGWFLRQESSAEAGNMALSGMTRRLASLLLANKFPSLWLTHLREPS